MSGALAGLSQYSDSESDEAQASEYERQRKSLGTSRPAAQGVLGPPVIEAARGESQVAAPPIRPKRKLPPLDADALHETGQDRSSALSSAPAGARKSKVIRGDWLCYCFVEVQVDPSLSKLLNDSHEHLQQRLGAYLPLKDLRIFGDASHRDRTVSPAQAQSSSSNSTESLHVSLTRPFTVRSHERDEYIKVATAEVQRLKETVGSFAFSFSRIAHLANDDESRHFMVLEIGAGRDKFHKLSTALSLELRRTFRTKAYYDEARFHASTACITASGPTFARESIETDDGLGPRFGKIVDQVETKGGARLRKCPPTWATRVGIQVANRISYVDL